MIAAPFVAHTATVRPEWIDDNGHMNLAYYVVVFDHATDALWAAIDLDEPYKLRTGHGTFAVECHILYRSELVLGDTVRVATQILATDSKRIHLLHEMQRTDTGTVVAQQELMLLHVDLRTRRVAPFLADGASRIAEAAAAHAVLPRPDWVGRRVAMPGSPA